MLVGTILQVGGIFGTFGLAWLVSRRGFVPIMSVTFAIACVTIGLIGQPGLSLATHDEELGARCIEVEPSECLCDP